MIYGCQSSFFGSVRIGLDRLDWLAMRQIMLHGETLSASDGALPEAQDAAPSATLAHRLRERAGPWFRSEALTEPPADLAEPFTLPWFVALEYYRHHRQARWLPEALEFGKHEGETVLALGYGLGTDWVPYARTGARVVIACPDSDELAITRHHFRLRGLSGVFLHATRPPLPLPSASVDLACASGFPEPSSALADWLSEVHRLLKPGGKLLLLQALPSNSFWAGRRLFRELSPYLESFEGVQVHRRHVRRRHLAWFWRCWPRRWLERWFGQFLLVRAHKPVHSIPTLAQAA